MTTRYEGGCHCGAVRFRVDVEDHLALACNCSMCSKMGYLHVIVPPERFAITKGQDQLTTYTFNTHVAKHMFCRVCGIKSYYVPRSHPDGYSVNARCLDPGTVTGMRKLACNGREWERQFSQSG